MIDTKLSEARRKAEEARLRQDGGAYEQLCRLDAALLAMLDATAQPAPLPSGQLVEGEPGHETCVGCGRPVAPPAADAVREAARPVASRPAPSKPLEEAVREAADLISWVINDVPYKAPETRVGLLDRVWLPTLKRALAALARERGE